MQIQLKFDSHKFITWLNDFELRQLPYAQSSALNGTAYKIQRYQRANMEKKFTIRNNWTLKGVIVEKATKQNLQVQIAIRDKYTARHEEGGTFKTKSKSWSIPLKDIKRNKRGIVTRAKWPARLKNKNIMIVKSKKGKGKIMLQRVRNNKPKLLWAFEPEIKLKPRLDFKKTAEAVANKFFESEFDAAFKRAIATGR